MVQNASNSTSDDVLLRSTAEALRTFVRPEFPSVYYAKLYVGINWCNLMTAAIRHCSKTSSSRNYQNEQSRPSSKRSPVTPDNTQTKTQQHSFPVCRVTGSGANTPPDANSRVTGEQTNRNQHLATTVSSSLDLDSSRNQPPSLGTVDPSAAFRYFFPQGPEVNHDIETRLNAMSPDKRIAGDVPRAQQGDDLLFDTFTAGLSNFPTLQMPEDPMGWEYMNEAASNAPHIDTDSANLFGVDLSSLQPPDTFMPQPANQWMGDIDMDVLDFPGSSH